MKKFYIIGSGGFSKQVIEIVETINKISPTYDLVGLIDDNVDLIGNRILDYRIVGTTDYLQDYSQKNEVYGIIAIANPQVKQILENKLKNVKWVNLIHPDTTITNYIKIGIGNVISGGVIINPNCEIGNHCHINIGSTFGHDVTLNDYVTIMPGSRLSGNVNLMSMSIIGTGSTIIQGLTIEENTKIAAGAVVIENAEKNSLYIGVPAKKYKKI